LRKADITDKNKTQLGFGEAWKKRQIVASKKEQEIIDKMKKLRAEGLSYWKIADVLNAWGIPTKTRRGRWHARTVQKILEAHDLVIMLDKKNDRS